MRKCGNAECGNAEKKLPLGLGDYDWRKFALCIYVFAFPLSAFSHFRISAFLCYCLCLDLSGLFFYRGS